MEAVERFWLSLTDNVVLLMVVMPLVGAGLVRLMRPSGPEPVYFTGLVNVWLTAGLAVIMVARFEPGQPDRFEFSTKVTSSLSWQARWERRPEEAVGDRTSAEKPQAVTARWKSIGPDVRLSVGVNRYSLWFLVLTVMTTLAAFRSISPDDRRLVSKLSWLLLTESAMLGVYAAQDVMLLAMCLMVSTLGLFFLIGQGSDPRRREAARRFFRMQTVSGMLLLFGLMGVAVTHWWMQVAVDPGNADLTFSLRLIVLQVPKLAYQTDAAHDLWTAVSPWLFATLCAGLVLRLPMPPLHNWWSRVSEQADSRIVALMAVGYLPLSFYLVVRIIVPLFPELITEMSPRLFLWGLLSALFLAVSTRAIHDPRRKLAVIGLASCCVAFGNAFYGELSGSQGGLLLTVATSGSLSLLCLSCPGLAKDQQPARPGEDDYSGTHVFERLPLILGIAGLAALPLSGSFWGWLLVVESVFRRDSSAVFWLLVTVFLMAISLRYGWSELTRWPERVDSTGTSERSIIKYRVMNVMPIILVLVATAVAPQWIVGPPRRASAVSPNDQSAASSHESDPATIAGNPSSLAKSVLNAE